MQQIGTTAVLEALIDRMEQLTPAHSAQWGTMTGQQMLRHLGDAAEAVLGRRAFASRPNARGATLKRLLLLYVLRTMPRGIRAGADPAGVAVDPARFDEDRSRAITLLRELATAPPAALVERHPVLGPMTRANWMRWAFLHTDHHLRQFAL